MSVPSKKKLRPKSQKLAETQIHWFLGKNNKKKASNYNICKASSARFVSKKLK